MHFGVDYGNQMSGTTCVCYSKNGKLHLEQSQKNRSADDFLKNLIQSLSPEFVFIDAPLSLPKVYFMESDANNYFFRKCDIELRSMSPMFLGGLTARAMQLRDLFKLKTTFIETHPSSLVKKLITNDTYKKKDPGNFAKFIESNFGISCHNRIENWHQIDAILAWISGNRFLKGKALSFGDEKEGVIWI